MWFLDGHTDTDPIVDGINKWPEPTALEEPLTAPHLTGANLVGAPTLAVPSLPGCVLRRPHQPC